MSKAVLFLDFADALGKLKKNDNFLHNLLARYYDAHIGDTSDVLIFTHGLARNLLFFYKKMASPRWEIVRPSRDLGLRRSSAGLLLSILCGTSQE
jgi:hypothetical protein